MSIAEKLTTIAQNQQKVYDAGFTAGQAQGGGSYNEGYTAGYDEGWENGYSEGSEDGWYAGVGDGYAQGEQEAYDRFWDAYQENGNRNNYDRAFGGRGWNAETFKPKYLPLRPAQGNMYMMFAYSDVGKIDESILDTSQIKTMSMSFYQNDSVGKQGVYHVEIDCSSLTSMGDAFNYNTRLETLVLKNVPATCNFTGGFQNCNKLTNFTVTGTIGGTTLNLQWSKLLTKESIKSIMYHLGDNGAGKTLTLSKTAVDNAFAGGYNGEDSAIGSETLEWDDMCQGVWMKNWTITLV